MVASSKKSPSLAHRLLPAKTGRRRKFEAAVTDEKTKARPNFIFNCSADFSLGGEGLVGMTRWVSKGEGDAERILRTFKTGEAGRGRQGAPESPGTPRRPGVPLPSRGAGGSSKLNCKYSRE